MGISITSGGVADVQAEPVQIGNNASAENGCVAIGQNVTATEEDRSGAIGIGENIDVGGNSVAIGHDINIGGTFDPGIAIGIEAEIGDGVAIGVRAEGTNGVTFGDNAESGDSSVAVGPSSQAAISGGQYSIAIGERASAQGNGSVAIGGERLNNPVQANGGGVAIGQSAQATGDTSVALGDQATASAQSGIAIGNFATASDSSSVAIGSNVSCGIPAAVRIGGTVTGVILGGYDGRVSDSDLQGTELTLEIDETAGAFRIRGRDSGGTFRTATIPW